MWHFTINSEHWANVKRGFNYADESSKVSEYGRGKYNSVFALSLPFLLEHCRVSGHCQKQNAWAAGALLWLVLVYW